ncbi:MAG: hypothetical protein WBA12_10820 [Catalinimonas sp.]
MRSYLLFVVVLFGTHTLAAQELLPAAPSTRLHYQTQVGAAWTGGQWGQGNVFYVSPFLSYDLNDRWTLHAGALVHRTQMVAPRFEAEGQPTVNAFGGASGYAGASYRASERLTLSGFATYDFMPMNTLSPYCNPSRWTGSFQADYKLSEHFSVGLNVSQGRGVYGYGVPFGSTFGRNVMPRVGW